MCTDALLGLQFSVLRGIALDRLDVHVQLVIEAALQLAALAGQFLWVEGELLVTRGTGGNATEIRKPRAAAQFPPAAADAADTPRLLARADLFHLHAHLETVAHRAHDPPEIDTVFGGVVHDGLGAVALVLHVGHLHIQPRLAHHLAAGEHGIVLLLAGHMPAVDVFLGGHAQHFA